MSTVLTAALVELQRTRLVNQMLVVMQMGTLSLKAKHTKVAVLDRIGLFYKLLMLLYAVVIVRPGGVHIMI